MTYIQIIKDRSKLEGTAYVELVGGAYANSCWNEGSLFFEEEVFGYIEPTITRYEPTYDHYAFTSIQLVIDRCRPWRHASSARKCGVARGCLGADWFLF